MDRTEQRLRRVAWACLTHAQALYQDACVLTQHTRDPRAVALAVHGIDEVVTAVAYTMAALNHHAGMLLPQTLKALLPHDVHYGSAITGAGETPEPREGGGVMAAIAGSPRASGSACRATLLHLTRQAMVPSSQCEAWEATDAIGTLTGLLATFSVLLDVLADDSRWHQFTATMRHHTGAPQAPSAAL